MTDICFSLYNGDFLTFFYASTCYICLLFEGVGYCTLILAHILNRYEYRSSLDGITFYKIQ